MSVIAGVFVGVLLILTVPVLIMLLLCAEEGD